MVLSVYTISIIFGILFLIFIVQLVRKNKLLEKYSLLWIFFAGILLVLSSTPFFIEKIASALDIKYAPSVLFLFGMVYLILYNVHMTVVYSKQSENLIRLTQEHAILKKEFENLKIKVEGRNE